MKVRESGSDAQMVVEAREILPEIEECPLIAGAEMGPSSGVMIASLRNTAYASRSSRWGLGTGHLPSAGLLSQQQPGLESRQRHTP